MSLTRCLVVFAGLTWANAACATGQQEGPGDPFEGAATADQDVLLTVENNNFKDATIFMHWSGVKRRLGMVTGKTTETFRTPWHAERVQLEVDFVGSGGYLTESVDVWRGDHLNFVILPGR